MKSFEVEQKYKVKLPAIVRKKIIKAGAVLLSKGQEKNELWDFKNILKQKSAVLRLREAAGGGLLTFKGPRLKSRFKKRVEVELPVDVLKFRQLLELLGFKPRISYQKYREEYKLSGMYITLDRIEKAGWFVEIEGAADKIEKTAARLGFCAGDREERSYLEIIYGKESIWRGK